MQLSAVTSELICQQDEDVKESSKKRNPLLLYSEKNSGFTAVYFYSCFWSVKFM
jgi:hypothetical protein